MRSISVAPAPPARGRRWPAREGAAARRCGGPRGEAERTLGREQPPALVQRAVWRVDEVLRKAVSPPFRAARQDAPDIGAQRRDEGALLVGAPEVHAQEVLVDSGEQRRAATLSS
ncbi:hypothetical protein ACFYO2_47130 [Streptomyces sp. NPDC006602]|uniref:hypothetical protein n=1 Tax=Streptomyces sp. NPDC006602 TaxID=3364751 RepID=UPI0036D1C4A7